MLNNSIKKLILILLLIVTIYLFYLILPFLTDIAVFLLRIIVPFIISFGIAFILQPVVLFVQKLVKKRILAVFLVVLVFTGLIALSLYLIIPYLAEEIRELVQNLPSIMEEFKTLVNSISQKLDFLPDNYRPSFENIDAWLSENMDRLSDWPREALSFIIENITYILIVPMTLIYFLTDYEKILCGIRDYLIEHGKIRFKNYLGEMHQTMAAFVRGTFIVMAILTAVCTIIFMIMNMEYALFFGLIIAITNVIPYLGPYIGGAFPVIYALLESPTKAIIVVIIISLIQQLESDYLTPYINGKKINVHPLIVILAVIIVGEMFGLVGMIFAIPILVILKITFKYYNPFKKKAL